jgi:PAS domain S-box-containing protein
MSPAPARYVPLALVIAAGLAISLAGFVALRGWERARLEAQFERRARGFAAAIEKGLASDLEVLYAIRALFEVSPRVDARAFRSFVEGSLRRNSNVQALSWNPRLLAGERARYEAAGRRDVTPRFEITELGAGGRLVRAGVRAEHVPVRYIEPRQGNEPALGFDILSDHVRREAIERAEGTGKPAATAKIRLVQEAGDQSGFLILMPVYRRDSGRGASREGAAGVLGFAVGVFRIGDMVTASLAGLDTAGVELRIADETERPPDLLFEFGHPGAGAPMSAVGDPALGWLTTLDVAGRRWSLGFVPTPAHVADQRGWLDWSALALGLALTAILVTYLATAASRSAALRESENRFRTAFARAAIGMALTTPDGRLLQVNRAYCEITGRSETELRATDFTSITHPDDRPENTRLIRRTLAGEIPGFVLEKRYVRPDGAIVWVQNNVSLARDERGSPVSFIALTQDITERKRAEADLRRLSRQLVDTQEIERRRLAREPHDEFGQSLGALKLNLERMKARPADVGAFLNESIDLVDHLVRQARSLALDLRPSLLDDFGLAPAVRWYVEKQAERGGLVAEILDRVARKRVPAEIETACFRVVQEAVTNVVRHAQARHVTVEITIEDAEVRLLVRDDGAGFDVTRVGRGTTLGGSFGILGMQERVALAGGRFELDSAPGRGTVVRARFPLAAPDATEA